jgi:competence protein ComEC
MYLTTAGRVIPHALVACIVGTALPYLGIIGGVFPVVLAVAMFFIALLVFLKRLRLSVALVCLAILLGLCIGSSRALYEIAKPSPMVPTGKHVIEGVIVREPDVRESYTAQTLQVERIDGREISDEYRVLLLAPRFPEFAYGDRLIATGSIALPEDFSVDETGRIFPYKKFLAKDDVYAIVRYPKIERVGEGQGNPILALLYQSKRAFLASLGRVVPEPENALLAGIILGEKRSLGKGLTEALRVSGIIHIVVLSGYNMTLVAQYLYAFLRFLGFYGRAGGAVIGIAFFALMAGGGATVVRAAIMAILALLARVTGRTDAATRSLLLAATLMLFHEPSIILYDPSFQLSFLATLGLIHGVAYLDPRVNWFSGLPLLREIVLSTIATQAFVLPLILYQSGVLPVYSLVANLLALPVVPIAMFLGFWTGVGASVSFLFGQFLGVFADLSARWILFVGETIASLPFSSVHLPAFSGFVLVLFYGALTLLLYRSRASLPPRLSTEESPRN